jgi:hypothetical protein
MRMTEGLLNEPSSADRILRTERKGWRMGDRTGNSELSLIPREKRERGGER